MLTQKIDQDLAAALKSGQSERLGVIRLLKTSLKNEQIKLGRDLTNDEASKVLLSQAKQRRDSIAAYNQANRPELAEAEAKELAIIEEYLPKQLSLEELATLVDEAITQAGPGVNIGQVIGAVKAKAGAAADGAAVAKLVRERLG